MKKTKSPILVKDSSSSGNFTSNNSVLKIIEILFFLKYGNKRCEFFLSKFSQNRVCYAIFCFLIFLDYNKVGLNKILSLNYYNRCKILWRIQIGARNQLTIYRNLGKLIQNFGRRICQISSITNGIVYIITK